MQNLTLNFMAVVFILYVVYALYACIAVFLRPDDRGAIFKGLRGVPILVLIYFLTPCAALYFLYGAFATAYPVVFWPVAVLLGGTSYLILLYFVTSPEWPIGRLLGLEKIKPAIIQAALVANFAFAFLVLAASSVTLYLLVPAINTEVQQKTAYVEIINEARNLDAASQKNMQQKTI